MAESDHPIFPFEKLRVGQEVRDWVRTIYGHTRNFPPEEKFGMTNQVNRAAVSVATNLAEGCGRVSPKDQAHFSQLSYGLLLEPANLLILAADRSYLSEEDLSLQRQRIAALTN